MAAIPSKDEVLNLLVKVGALLGPLAGDQPREVARHDLEIFALFDRCRSLSGAVHLLIERGFAHEAVMLTRPLLSDSLALGEMAAADDM